jgi:lipopolysaccharide transport system permease protein
VAEYFEYATLLRHLTVRDLRLRFQNPVLGVFWAILQPLLPALIFAVVFARVLQPATGGVPYSLSALAGFVPWSFFSTSVSAAGMTFVWNANLLKKVYFPRGILPASATLASSVELAGGVVLLCGWSIWSGYPPRWSWLWLPALAGYVAAIAFFVSLGLATANALNRNVKFAVPFAMQLWIYVSPVIYPASFVVGRWRWMLGLNPLTGAFEGFRTAIYGAPLDRTLFLMSFCSAILFAVAALVLFHRFEDILAERV